MTKDNGQGRAGEESRLLWSSHAYVRTPLFINPSADFFTTTLWGQKRIYARKPKLRNGIIAGRVGVVAVVSQRGRAGED